jgi:hypothetical protein
MDDAGANVDTFVPKPLFRVPTQDRLGALWQRLMEHYRDRLADLRKMNDAPVDAETTAFMRGRIAELKHLLNLNEENERYDN